MIRPPNSAGTGPGYWSRGRAEAETIGSAARALTRQAVGPRAEEPTHRSRVVTKFGTEACETARPVAGIARNAISLRPALARPDSAQENPMNTREALDTKPAGAIASITFTACDLLVAARARPRAQARPAARGTARAKPAERRREL